MKRKSARVKIANPADGGFFYWLFKYYLFGGIALVLLGAVGLVVAYLVISGSVKTPPNIKAYDQEADLVTQIYAADGRVLTTLSFNYRYLVEMDDVPPLLIKAFLAAEDRSFFEHGGVDFRGIARAALANLKAGVVRQGGSTITQQVAKTYLSPERTIQRKVNEIVLARRIEARFSKRDILYLYLNRVFFGANAYGVKAAAKIYFDKQLKDLTTAEMALLAGLVRAPSRYSPRASLTRATRRRDQVLNSMLDAGFIDATLLAKSKLEPVTLASSRGQDALRWLAPHFTEHVRRELNKRYGKDKVYSAGWKVHTTIDLPVHKLARDKTLRAVRALDKRQGWRGPLFKARGQRAQEQLLKRVAQLYPTDSLVVNRPYPTLITKVKRSRAFGLIGERKVVIPESLMEWAAPYSRTNSENGRVILSVKDVLSPGDVVWTIAPPRWLRRRAWGKADDPQTTMSLHQVPRVEGALYTYDYHSGYVLAMVGGLDYDRSTYNRCVQSCRQPGSTYKPIYYSLALDGNEYSMGTILQDKPYEPEPGEEWNPQNVHGTLDGKVTMHMSLVRSLNLPSIQLLNAVGAKETEAWARRLGFTTPIHADKALALGASCVRTDELTRSFATFARGGTQQDPLYVRQILDRNDQPIEDHTIAEDPLISEDNRLDRIWAWSDHVPDQIIDPKTAFLMTKLLRDSVLYGISARCQIVPAPTGGKGGTSSDTMDVWFVGFSSRWATTAWIGDDTYQRPLGAKEASYTSAIPMWAEFMRDSIDGRPTKELPFTSSKGLKSTSIDFQTGGAPQPDSKSVRIYFKPGTFSLPEEGG